MRRIAVLLVTAVCLGAPLSEVRARRESARKEVADGVLVLAGSPRADAAQQADFYYLTGWKEPGALLLLTADSELLFLPKHDPVRERYTGPRLAATDKNAAQTTGFDSVLPVDQFETEFAKALASHSTVLALNEEPWFSRLKSLAPLRAFRDAEPLLSKLRSKKSPYEIAQIQHAVDVSVEAHRAAWKRIAAGLFEYQVAATMTYTMLEAGCEGTAYPPIAGSGPNATVLHYSANSRRMEKG